jgi:hypothetical protein
MFVFVTFAVITIQIKSNKRKYYDENNNVLFIAVDYTRYMSMLPFAAEPPRPRSKEVVQAGLLFAGILVIFAVGQLFSFEKFVPLMESYGLPGGHPMATAIACILVVSEVFALPFLLRMTTSPLMRWTGMVCAWIAVVVWSGLVVWQNATLDMMTNTGILGASITLPVGWWSIWFCLALLILAGWTSWGLWPQERRAKKSRKY